MEPVGHATNYADRYIRAMKVLDHTQDFFRAWRPDCENDPTYQDEQPPKRALKILSVFRRADLAFGFDEPIALGLFVGRGWFACWHDARLSFLYPFSS